MSDAQFEKPTPQFSHGVPTPESCEESDKWRKRIIEKGPFKPFYIKRSRHEGYVFWPEKNLADGVEWGINEANIRLATECYVASLNFNVFKKELTIEECITRPDWKPLTWFQENEPQLTHFDYYFTPEQLKLSIREKSEIVKKKDDVTMQARYIAYMEGRDFYDVIKELMHG